MEIIIISFIIFIVYVAYRYKQKVKTVKILNKEKPENIDVCDNLKENWNNKVYNMIKLQKFNISMGIADIICRHYALHDGWVVYYYKQYKEKFGINYSYMKRCINTLLSFEYSIIDDKLTISTNCGCFVVESDEVDLKFSVSNNEFESVVFKFFEDRKCIVCEFYNYGYYDEDHNIIILTEDFIFASGESSLFNKKNLDDMLRQGYKNSNFKNLPII